ncbi:MAG: lipoyl(octanoyl) transferase LipB [Bacteriovoracaceae bacterium]
MIIEDLGTLDYQTVLDKQLLYRDEVEQELREETVIICNHPPVVTIGRQAEKKDYENYAGNIVAVSRGGFATYHGPNQLIIYPIVNIEKRNLNLAGHLVNLENVVINVMKEFGVVGFGLKDERGVWVNVGGVKRKIASIGVACKKWVTYHGLAFNVLYDSNAFKGINPCGYPSETMISLEELVPNQKIDMDQVKAMIIDQSRKIFCM